MEKPEAFSQESFPKPSKVTQLLDRVKRSSLARKVSLAGAAVLMSVSGGEAVPGSSPAEVPPAHSPIVQPVAVPTTDILVQTEAPPSPAISATPQLPDLIPAPVETPVPKSTIIPLPTFEITQSVEVKIPNNILDSVGILDIAPEAPNDLVRQEKFVGYNVAIRQIMGSKYPSFELLQKEYGKEALNPTKWPEVFGKYPDAGRIYNALTLLYQDHGIDVTKALNKAGILTGTRGRPYMYPLENLFTPQNVQVEVKSPRASSLSIIISPESVTGAIQEMAPHLPGKNKVINMSFQVGNMGAEFWIADPKTRETWLKLSIPVSAPAGSDVEINGKLVKNETYYYIPAMANRDDYQYSFRTNPDQTQSFYLVKENGEEIKLLSGTEEEINKVYLPALEEYRNNIRASEWTILGSYRKETAPQNVPKLIQVAKNVDGQGIFVVAAAGNWGDDLRETKNLLAFQKNLLVQGVWYQQSYENSLIWEGPVGNVYGAEIYVPNFQLDLAPGSSFATPVVSDLVESLLSGGIPYGEVKSKILAEFCDDREYTIRTNTGTEIEKAKVLNLLKVQEYFRNK